MLVALFTARAMQLAAQWRQCNVGNAFRYSAGMPYNLFPGSPNLRSLFSRHAIRSQWRSNGPVVVSTIIMICTAIWVVELLLSLVWPAGLEAMVGFGRIAPLTALRRPWTFITSMFLHQPRTLLHILFNMLTLWSVGPVLERLMGHWPFLMLYVLSGIGGGAGMMVWAALAPGYQGWLTAAYGASGALFGLFAAMMVVFRRTGQEMTSMFIWMAINFAMPLIVPGIAWQAHVGGFIAGGVLTLLLTHAPRLRRRAGAVRPRADLLTRTLAWGAVLLAVMIAVMLACEVANPIGLFS